MKKLKLIIFAAAIILFVVGTNLTHAFQIDSTKLNTYSSLYDTEQVAITYNIDCDNKYECYYNFNLPVCVNMNDEKYIYVVYDLSKIEYQYSNYVRNEFITIKIDNEKDYNFTLSKNGLITNSNAELIEQSNNTYLYKLDFSNIGDNHYITNINFKILYNFDLMKANEKIEDDAFNIQSEYSGPTLTQINYFDFIEACFNKSFSGGYNFYFIDHISYEDKKIHIYLINTYNYATLDYIVIDSKTCQLIQDKDYINHYYISESDTSSLVSVGTHTFNINQLAYKFNNESTYHYINVNEEFTFISDKKYIETHAISLAKVDDPLIGYTHSYIYSALFNSIHGRIENAQKVKLKFEYSKYKNFKKSENISLEYDISYNNEVKNQDKIGNIRKLNGDERMIASWEPSFIEQWALAVQQIELAKFQYDYEFKIQGYIKENNLEYCSVVYAVENGSIAYGSFYKNALNWDDLGNVYDGEGVLQEGYIYDGNNIIDADGNIVEPENNNIKNQLKSKAYEALGAAFKDGQKNFWNKVKDIFSNIKTGANKAAIIAAAIVGVLFVVLFIKLLRWIFKK